MDLFTHVIVSWSVDDNMQESLDREPLEKALLKRKIQPGLIIHFDRGGQYLSDKMKELVHTFGLK
jgi:transposase InsO family protein